MFIPLNVYASQGGSYIEITSVKPGQQFNNSTLVPTSFSGTFFSPDPQQEPLAPVGTLTADPLITVDLDNRPYGSGSFTGTTWSITGGTIPDGWHTVTAFLDDSNGDHNVSITFQVLTAKFQATKYNNIIAIEYSGTCETMISHNITDQCPSVQTLMSWDNTNQAISGKFTLQKDGTYVREKPEVPNFYQFYSSNNYTTICVLCDVNLASQDVLPVIFLEPHGFSFADISTILRPEYNVTDSGGGNLTLSENGDNDKTLVIDSDRSIQGCNTANLVYSWSLLNNTINYFESGCTAKLMNTTSSVVIPTHPIDYQHSPQYMYDKYVRDQLALAVNNCITQKCTPVANPQHSVGFGWG